MSVRYTDQQQAEHYIKCSWLIGADGKRGVVRKRFLEPDAGIRQVEGSYTYEGTWVATNLQFIPPTAQSHPQLPFWDLGMTPEEVCDLYWPKGWHFCTPPGKATACGRFGPYKDRLWRHEFAEPEWNDSMDPIGLFWDHITPMITREKTSSGKRFPNGPIVFPRDCINIVRCRPFVFAQKCVNKWFDNRRVLIGDSAHVFPPFGKALLCRLYRARFANHVKRL
jgi:2-polyprenyl-6-methoxyphenol hydroxylase-like FAD-dependent oxidoreductase